MYNDLFLECNRTFHILRCFSNISLSIFVLYVVEEKKIISMFFVWIGIRSDSCREKYSSNYNRMYWENTIYHYKAETSNKKKKCNFNRIKISIE